MPIVVARSPEIASRHAAHLVRRLLQRQPDAALLLPTGSTSVRLYELLGTACQTGQISFARAQTFNLDEYLGLSPHHRQSYRRFMADQFFSRVDLKKNRAHLPAAQPADPVKHCLQYEAKIARANINLAILGLGRNGHLAFNEPGTPFDSITHVADLSASTIAANARFFDHPEDVPRQAITAGLATIMRAQHIILLAFGPDKAEAIRAALQEPASPDHPASILQRHRHVTYILDQAAASRLQSTEFQPPVLGKIRLYSSFNLPRAKRIVFFSPHPDDAAICAGATLSELARHNEVHEIIVTTGHRAVITPGSAEQHAAIREREVKAEAKILGTRLHLARCRFYDNGQELNESDLKRLRSLIHRLQPDLAFLPHQSDTHPTHIQTRKLALAALPHDIQLWCFETPWGLFSHSRVNAAFEFSADILATKLAAIRCHLSQLARTAFDDAARDIAHFRRITLGEQYFSELGQSSLQTEPYLELFQLSNW